jgi:hypothetical protein
VSVSYASESIAQFSCAHFPNFTERVKCLFSALNSDYTFSDDRYEHALYFRDDSDTTGTGLLKSQPMQFKTFADTIWTRLGVM